MFISPSSVPDTRFCGPPSLCQMFSGRLTAFVLLMPVVITYSCGCDVRYYNCMLLGGLMKTTKKFSQDCLCSSRAVEIYLQSSILLNHHRPISV